ncbi:MAG: Pyrrolo-quinoline quinone, partial [Planctomycetota bacterium]
MFVTRYLIAVCFFVGAISAESSESDNDWPRWRGPQDSGSIEFGSYPVQLDAAHVLWQAPLPGKGCSTPIVWQQTIYLTAPINGNDGLLSFDWAGKQRWQATFGQEKAGKHRNGSGSNASPVTDG